jgi:hypothetical protein
MAAEDPDAMAEGDSDLSGFRHGSGESHFATGQATTTAPLPGARGDGSERDREPDFNPDLA